MRKELIIEIGTEELPTNFLKDVNNSLKNIVLDELRKWNIPFQGIETYSTPRRLLIFINDLNEKQNDKKIEKQGPPIKIFYSDIENKKISNAGEKFLKNNNLTLENITIKKTKKGDYIFISKIEKGKQTLTLINDIIINIIKKIHLPKSMRWNSSEFEFIRPIRWLNIKYNNKKVDLKLAGIESISHSYGHRILFNKKIEFNSIIDFKKKLKERYVIFDFKERKEIILSGIKNIIESISDKNLNIEEDEELIEENANMVEYPFLQLCKFKENFKKIPSEIISTAIKHHQKAFPVFSGKKITNYFIVILNNKPNNNTKKGNERVVNARLNDAKFFFEEDRKKGKLENFNKSLNEILFLKSLGTLQEKVNRIKDISAFLVEKLNIDKKNKNKILRCAHLCKADLMSSIVYEFPELQGKAGKIYAELDEEDPEVAVGIDEHYKPRNAEDTLPESLPGKIVGISDKIDTIAGCFSINLIPTGSLDPYQLRRFSLAIINIILQNKFSLNIKELIIFSLNLYKKNGFINEIKKEKIEEIFNFIKNRFKSILIEKEFTSDEIESILSTEVADIYDMFLRIKVLHKFREKENFKNLLSALKRMNNILKGIKIEEINFQENLLIEKEEKELYNHHSNNKIKFFKYLENKNYEQCMEILSTYKERVDNFFDKVLVMDKDEKIRNNRLSLLYDIVNSFKILIEFSKIQG